MRRSLLLVCFLVMAAVGIVYVLRRAPSRIDPTQAGPERTLAISSLQLEGKSALRGECATNLPDGAALEIRIETRGETVDVFSATVASGIAPISRRSAGTVTNGTYDVVAKFQIEEQPSEVRLALHHQPRSLRATRTFPVTTAADPAGEVRPRLLALVREANARANDPVALERLRRETDELLRGLWLSSLVPAARRLKSALDLAPSNVEQARSRLVEAEVLSSY